MVLFSQSRPGVLPVSSFRNAWIGAAMILTLAAVALGCVFSAEAVGAFRVWIDSRAYNHCFLVLPVAVYLAWTRRESVQGLLPHPELRALILLVPLTLLWMVAARISILELQQLTVVLMFQVIALGIVGWRIYRAMLIPFLYLFFLVPFGYFLVPYLQDWTAAFAVMALKIVGIPVYSDGMFIEVPSGNFVVAEACAGLRFLIASVAFGVLFSALMYKSRWRAIAFITLSIIVPVIANGFRAFGIIALSELSGSATAIEADHVIYGWVFFTAVTLLLIVIGTRFSDDPGSIAVPRASTAAPSGVTSVWVVMIAGVLGVALAASGPAYAQFRNLRASGISLAATPFGSPSAQWISVSPLPFSWKPLIDHPDRERLDAYTSGQGGVQLYVALYKDAGFHNNLVRSTNEIADGKLWRLASNGSANANIDGKNSAVATTDITDGVSHLIVWHFYVVGGRIAATPLRAKLLQLWQLFATGQGIDAFVAVAAEDAQAGSHAQDALRAFTADFNPPGFER